MSSHSSRLTPLKALALRLSAAGGNAEATDNRPCLLIVDDDPTVRDSLARALALDYRVVLCGDGREACARVNDDIAAVVLDIRMPKGDGFSIYRAIRASRRHLPIIFYSAYQDLKDPYEIMNEYRPFAYISKGQPLETMLDILGKATQHHAEVTQHHQIARRMQLGILKELNRVLRSDEAAFFSRHNQSNHGEVVAYAASRLLAALRKRANSALSSTTAVGPGGRYRHEDE